MSVLPPAMRVPATPVVESVDIRALYDVEHATLLGKGGFSQVVAVLHRPSGTMRALKVLKKEVLTGKVAAMVVHEREILRRTSHPNVITLHESITTPHHIYFALELMNVDLFELIVRNRRIPEGVARRIMHQLLCAVSYLHSQCIVHRDIKPENILLRITETRSSKGQEQNNGCEAEAASTDAGVNNNSVSSSSNNGAAAESDWEATHKIEVKLADFGLAKLVQEWDVQSTPCGTSFYIAPEVIRGIEAQGAKPLCTTQQLVKSVDVWSAGIVLFVMLSGRPPFHGQVKTSEERRQLLHCIDHGVLFNARHGWDTVSDEAKDLIARMLEQNSSKRLTALQALQHPFFTNHGFAPPGPAVVRPVTSPPPQPQQQQQQQVSKEAPPAGTQMSADQANAGWKSAAVPNEEVTKKRRNFRNMFGIRKQSKRHGGKSTTPTTEETMPTDGAQQQPIGEYDDGGADEDEEQLRIMQEEIDAIQQDIIATGDADGDKTSYTQTMPVKVAPRFARPAVMNAKAKVGPAALKK
ncbi:protein kinase [Trypanosoma grayi]|uniref:protein kinase n=1 Tax=Trypanosoma grayi TaxID=71804 RepID=UPI0004F3FD32|nr:protein kinase [Trypanosoma grayi]KEG11533.1 protein kinase [Trypanosoma grayi]